MLLRKKRLCEIHTDIPPHQSPVSIHHSCPHPIHLQDSFLAHIGHTSIPGGLTKPSVQLFGVESIRVGGNLFAMEVKLFMAVTVRYHAEMPRSSVSVI